jgi:pimeloyl-ACP methyl ester carboxylesterase
MRLSVRACGPDPKERPDTPVVMFLHGFPEAAFVWDEVMLGLGQHPTQPVRCIAPNLRGFECSSSPTAVDAYRAKHIAGDITQLAALLAGPTKQADRPLLDALVAHDWGGAIAWNLAIAQTQAAGDAKHQRQGLMKQLLILNSPHPYTFWRELVNSPTQQAASAYMTFLCRPDAERLLSENDYARLWPFFTHRVDAGDATPAPRDHWLTDAVKDQFRAVWGLGLKGGCNYYRASPLKPTTSSDSGAAKLHLSAQDFRIEQPVRVLWGLGDTALQPALLDGLEACIPDLQVTRLAHASHWLVHEQPNTVLDFVRQALSG